MRKRKRERYKERIIMRNRERGGERGIETERMGLKMGLMGQFTDILMAPLSSKVGKSGPTLKHRDVCLAWTGGTRPLVHKTHTNITCFK